MRTCYHCKTLKSDDDFAWKNRVRGTRAKECRVCHAEMRRAHYAIHGATEREGIKRRKREIRAWLKAHKATLHCERCGENHPAALDFHHRNEAEKTVSIAQLGWHRTWGLKRIQAELAKCEVLCANCHRKEHWQRRLERTARIELATPDLEEQCSAN